MARNGSGTYNRAVSDYVGGTVISETAVNSEMDDIASALTQSMSKDGQTTPTANQPMATFRHTGVGNGAARTDYAALGQVQDSTPLWLGTSSGTAHNHGKRHACYRCLRRWSDIPVQSGRQLHRRYNAKH